MARWPGKIKAHSRNSDIVGGLDFMATFAAPAGIELPKQDSEGKPIIFDSYDMSPVLFGTGKAPRKTWFFFTESELSPGAIRYDHWKSVFNLRGDNGQHTGSLAVDTNLGWKSPDKYVATVPQIFDLWQDPQERYDLFMSNWTEKTWVAPLMNDKAKKLMKTYVEYPRVSSRASYCGPITLRQYQRYEWLRESLEKDGFSLPLPGG